MDDIDRAQAREEEFRADAEAERRRHWQANSLQPIGFCHWCNEPVRGKLLFCDKDCLQDHEAEQRRLRREGRA